MKKSYLILVALFSLAISTLSFAEPRPTTGYTTQILSKNLLANFVMIKPTNIVVVNMSDYRIHALVPNNDQPIDSGATGLITHNTYSGNTIVQITDDAYNTKFTIDACRREVIIVRGGPYVFEKKEDRSNC